MFFWVQNTDYNECWETAVGQEIYRIIIVDLAFSCLGTPLYYAIRYAMKRSNSKRFDLPPFDISYACLNLVLNQMFMWLGMVYAPILPVIVTVKMAIVFYVKVSYSKSSSPFCDSNDFIQQKLAVIHFCKAPSKLWRTSQTQTLFMVLTFLTLFAVTIINGYIATQ